LRLGRGLRLRRGRRLRLGRSGLDRPRPGHFNPVTDLFRLSLVINDFGFDAHVGPVRHLIAESFEAIEILDGAAVFAFGLGAVTEHEANRIGFFCDAPEAFGYAVIAVLRARDFDIAVTDHVRVHGDEGIVRAVEDVVEGAGEHARIEAGAAEHHLLRESDSLDRDEFLGVDRFIAGYSVGPEFIDFGEIFETHDGEGRGAEAVVDRVGIGHAKRFSDSRSNIGANGIAGIFRLLIGNEGKSFGETS
jgi:hypothetical protein